ncbi:myosin-G heavy chain-like protein [Rhynchospora pubera]|uniref:Myosin-G heavy chain-like protein n=1 Tax=Rhynchospora pubera TaxID=906938 RepID=A0AAV8C1F7_9POAL|nr:myosin-G heavy chain-like protein [Rhynchospora pubera]
MALNLSPSSSSLSTPPLKLQSSSAFSMSQRLPFRPTCADKRRTCQCKAATPEGATEDPRVEVSSAQAQLDLLEQLTSSPTPPDSGYRSDETEMDRPTIREQLSGLFGDTRGEFTLPLGKRLKENVLTISKRRNIKRQALLNEVGKRNDSVFFATVGAFVIVPPFAILAIAVLTGYVDLMP